MDISAFTSVPLILWLIILAAALVVLFVTKDKTNRQRLLFFLGYILIIIILLAAIPYIRPYPAPPGAAVVTAEPRYVEKHYYIVSPTLTPTPSNHSMMVDRVEIDEAVWAFWGNTASVSVPKNTRTTIYSKTITVPSNKTHVWLCARTWLYPSTPVAARTAYIAVDGVDIASAYSTEVHWLPVAGWTTLTPGQHTVTVDMIQNQDGKTAELSDAKGLIMVCRYSADKYVSFSDTDVRTAYSRLKLCKVVIGVKSISYGDGNPYVDCYVKVTDKFGNYVEEQIQGEWTTNPILKEFPYMDDVTVTLRSGDDTTASWISYLTIIYEVYY